MKTMIIFTPSKSIASFFVSSEANLPKKYRFRNNFFFQGASKLRFKWNKKMKQIVIRGNCLANLLIQ